MHGCISGDFLILRRKEVRRGMQRLLSSGEAAMRLGVTTRTLQKWNKKGILKPVVITPTGRFKYSEKQINQYKQGSIEE